MRDFFKKAFTLGEVLIAMAVIGIVAGLTIPDLVASHREKEIVAKVRKNYATLSNVFAQIDNETGLKSIVNSGDTAENISEAIAELMKPLLKYDYYCGANDTTATCAGIRSYGTDTSAFVLNDGTLVEIADATLANISPTLHQWAYVAIDLNGGESPPNAGGWDRFGFLLTENGLLPIGSPDFSSNASYTFAQCTNFVGLSRACTAWIVAKGNMDYMKADNTGKCPNGTVLSWDGASSCN